MSSRPNMASYSCSYMETRSLPKRGPRTVQIGADWRGSDSEPRQSAPIRVICRSERTPDAELEREAALLVELPEVGARSRVRVVGEDQPDGDVDDRQLYAHLCAERRAVARRETARDLREVVVRRVAELASQER